MQPGFNGATTMTNPYQVDVQIASEAGYDVLEITATKLDKYLQAHSLADARKLLDNARMKAHAMNSIENINLRDVAGRAEVLARTRQLSEYARALACPWIISVPGPAPAGTQWDAIRDDTVAALRNERCCGVVRTNAKHARADHAPHGGTLQR